MGLREYKRKRDFTKTAEPAGDAPKKKAARQLKYVIQKHAARRLHYDLRLELDGVYKSWAVPKGPTLDPAQKHLAVEVEDHPLEYGKFEGTIPAGEYGGGEVIVWDRGTWTPDGDPHEGMKKGRLAFTLKGEKLEGAWSLVRIKGREGTKTNWLFIKRRDEFVRPGYDITVKRPESVKTQRRIEELKAKPAAKAKKPRRKTAKTVRATGRTAKRTSKRRVEEVDGAKAAKLPRDASPQLAVLAAEPPQGGEWVHEIKFDGYRILAHVEDGAVRLITRKKQDWTHRYQEVAERLAELPVESAIIDGELVALVASGVSSFQALQNAGKESGAAQLAFFAFDLLYLDGFDLRACSLADRKRLLVDILPTGDETIRYSEHFATNGPEFLKECCRLGLEGIISKRADRPYISGRTADWVKGKCLGSEELVIGGFTMSEKVPQGFGALLMGYYDDGELVYAGRVGTGFTSAVLLDMRRRLEALRQEKSPFPNIPKREVDRTVRWVKPKLVGQIQFTGWTDAGVMRHPSFQGLREDKPATAVTRPASLALPPSAEPKTMKKANTTKSTKAKVKKRPPKTPPTELPGSVSVKLTSPDRELFPDIDFTKLQLATYYAQVAQWMLPHVVDRPLSLVRCPDGQPGQCFFQKHTGPGTPKTLGRVMVPEKKGSGEYLFVRDIDSLVSLAQISALEIHIWGSLCDKVDRPDRLIFDLDPDPEVQWPRVVEGAVRIRDILAERGLQSFVKTTGGKGLHVVVPLSPRRADWEKVKSYAKSLAEELASAEPNGYTSVMSKAARKGKIFVDYLRNDSGSTAIAPYSTRAKPGGTVAMPVEWKELPSIRSDQFNVNNALKKIESRKRDPWEEIFEIRQTL